MIEPEVDLLALTKFKHKRIYDAGRVCGFRELAQLIGVGYGLLLQYAALTENPFSVRGGYRRSAQKIAEYFGEPAEVLFPASLYALNFPKEIARSFSSQQIVPMLEARGMTAPALLEENIAHQETHAALEAALDTLRPHHRRVMRMRFGFDGEDGKPRTLEEVSEAMHLGVERIRQIENKALEKLRHPVRADRLMPYAHALGYAMGTEEREPLPTHITLPKLRCKCDWRGLVCTRWKHKDKYHFDHRTGTSFVLPEKLT